MAPVELVKTGKYPVGGDAVGVGLSKVDVVHGVGDGVGVTVAAIEVAKSVEAETLTGVEMATLVA